MRQRIRERLRTYWWVWVAIAVAAVILNELFDRKVAGDKKGHPGGDVLVAIVVVLIVFGVWEFVAARRSRQRS
ncbi:MAG: hypothetical protein ACXVFD_12630 [Gaiellaceae bacterium]